MMKWNPLLKPHHRLLPLKKTTKNKENHKYKSRGQELCYPFIAFVVLMGQQCAYSLTKTTSECEALKAVLHSEGNQTACKPLIPSSSSICGNKKLSQELKTNKK